MATNSIPPRRDPNESRWQLTGDLGKEVLASIVKGALFTVKNPVGASKVALQSADGARKLAVDKLEKHVLFYERTLAQRANKSQEQTTYRQLVTDPFIHLAADGLLYARKLFGAQEDELQQIKVFRDAHKGLQESAEMALYLAGSNLIWGICEPDFQRQKAEETGLPDTVYSAVNIAWGASMLALGVAMKEGGEAGLATENLAAQGAGGISYAIGTFKVVTNALNIPYRLTLLAQGKPSYSVGGFAAIGTLGWQVWKRMVNRTKPSS